VASGCDRIVRPLLSPRAADPPLRQPWALHGFEASASAKAADHRFRL